MIRRTNFERCQWDWEAKARAADEAAGECDLRERAARSHAACAAHERAALLLQQCYDRRHVDLHDQCLELYFVVLTDHRSVQAAWKEELRVAVAEVTERFEAAHHDWWQGAEPMLRVQRTWDAMPPHLDDCLRDVERWYRVFTAACDDAAAVAAAGGARELGSRVAEARGAAAEKQDVIRRLRLTRGMPEPIGWDDEGEPRFNPPRPPCPRYDEQGLPPRLAGHRRRGLGGASPRT